MKNLIIAILAMGFVGTASAGDFRSEGHYQANAGETFFEGSFGYLKMGADFDPSGELDADTSVFLAGVEHGLSENYSIYVFTVFTDTTIEAGAFEFDKSGLGPLNLGTNITHATSMGHFISNFELEFNYEDGEGTNALDSENNQDGSTNLSAMIGHRFNLDHANWGLRLELGLLAGDSKYENGPDSENDTGYSLSAFYETHIMESTVGLADLVYSDDGDDQTDLALNLTARFDVDEQMSVLGGLSYSTILDSDTFDNGNNLGLLVGLRYAM